MSGDLLLFYGLIIGVFTFLFYIKSNKQKFSFKKHKLQIIIVTLLTTIYNYLSHDIIPVPFRFIILILLQSFIIHILIKQSNSNIAIVTFINMVLYMLFFICNFLIYFILLPFNVNFIGNVISAFILQILVYIILYKLSPFHKIYELLEQHNIQYSIYVITVIILLWHSFLTYGDFKNEFVYYVSTIVTLLATMGLIIFLFQLVKKNQVLQITTSYWKGERDINHKNHTVVPSLIKTTNILYKGLEELENKSKISKTDIANLKNRVKATYEFSTEFADEFLSTQDISKVNSLKLSSKLIIFQGLFLEFEKECKDNNIDFNIIQRTDINKIDLLRKNQLKIVRLMQDLFSNALRELIKTDVEDKYIYISFSKNNNNFQINISDNAHQFSPSIFSKLGEYENSTNNSGVGMRDIFNTLQNYKASFILLEESDMYEKRKTITVRFDKKQDVVIQTYRANELKPFLENTNIKLNSTN